MKKLLQLITLLYSQMGLAQSFTLLPNSVSSNALNTTANRVGINISNPNYELHVNRNGNVGVYSQFTNNATGNTSSNGLIMGINENGEAILNQQSNNPLILKTYNTERLRVDSLGIFIFNMHNLRFKSTNISFIEQSSQTSDVAYFLRSDIANTSLREFGFLVNSINKTGTYAGVNRSKLVEIMAGSEVSGVAFRSFTSKPYWFGGTSEMAMVIDPSEKKVGVNLGSNLPTRTLDVNGDVRMGLNGTTLTAINNATAWIDLPSLAPNGSYYKDVNVANVDAGKNTVMVSPSIALPFGYMITYSKVTASNLVRIGFHNASNNTIDLDGMDFYITVITFP